MSSIKTKILQGKSNSINNKNESWELFNMNMIIPSYQRPYSWGKKEIEQLLKDLHQSFFDQKNDEYYLGNIMLQEMENCSSYEIIDGQQRTTTYFLVFMYLFIEICNQTKKDTSESLGNKKNTYKALFDKISNAIQHQDPDRQIFTQIYLKQKECYQYGTNNDEIITELKTEIKKEKKDPHVDRRFWLTQAKKFSDAFKYINKFFKNRKIDYLIEFIESMIYKTIFFGTIIPKDYSVPSQILFEKINNRGLKLDAFDKLKAFFMQDILQKNDRSEIIKFNDNWGHLISNTDNDTVQFIKYFFDFQTKNKDIKKDDIDSIYLIIKEKGWTINETFEKILKISRIFKKNLKDEKNNDILACRHLFNCFNYFKYEIIYINILSKLDDKNIRSNYISNEEVVQLIKQILLNVFKFNFCYKFILNLPTQEFITDVITPLNEKINDVWDNRITDEDNLKKIKKHISESFSDYRKRKYGDLTRIIEKNNTFSSDDSWLYYGKKNNNKYFYLLKILMDYDDLDTVNSITALNNIFGLEKSEIDHIVPQTKPRIILHKGEDPKPLYRWEKNEDYYEINDEVYKKYKKTFKQLGIKQKIGKQKWNEKIIQPFYNLRILADKDNKSIRNTISLESFKKQLDETFNKTQYEHKAQKSLIDFINSNH